MALIPKELCWQELLGSNPAQDIQWLVSEAWQQSRPSNACKLMV